VKRTLLCFGLGYSAEYLIKRIDPSAWNIIGTTRDVGRKSYLEAQGYTVYALETIPDSVWNEVSHIVHSVVPTAEGDPVSHRYMSALQSARKLEWFAYLSTTGVYGDHQGAWVDEETQLNPPSERLRRRVDAEQNWLAHIAGANVFRLAGIYGPGRSVIDEIRTGSVRRIFKEGQVFSRIHVEDIARTLHRSMESPLRGEIFNVCDNEPAPAHEVVSYACGLMQVLPPPMLPFETAQLSEMAREFYNSNRRVSNQKIREKLGVELRYPTYREGVSALVKAAKSAD
jgi:nucleoside-diphosphate-sugar epimerase